VAAAWSEAAIVFQFVQFQASSCFESSSRLARDAAKSPRLLRGASQTVAKVHLSCHTTSAHRKRKDE
jgi:hypothetical protein